MAKEFVTQDGKPLFTEQAEVRFKLNGWTHTSLMRKVPTDDDVKVKEAVAAYCAGKKVRPEQVLMFERSLKNGIVPYLSWESTLQAWTFGDGSLKPREIGQELVKRALAWHAAGADRRGKLILPAHSTDAAQYWRGITYSWTERVAPDLKGAIAPPGGAMSATKAKQEVCDILGLCSAEWQIVTTTVELYAKFPDTQDGGTIWGGSNGPTFSSYWRRTGIIKRDRSYIFTPPDLFGNMAILEGPLCDFLWMHFGHSGEDGHAGNQMPVTAAYYDSTGKAIYSTSYNVTTRAARWVPPGLGGTSGVNYSTGAPDLPFKLSGAKVINPGATVFELSGWKWAISGFSSVRFRDIVGLVLETDDTGYQVVKGDVSIAQCAMPVMNFREFINAAGRDKQGKLVKELESTLKSLEPYNDGVFLATVQPPESVVDAAAIDGIEVIGMAREAGKMDDDLGKGVTLNKAIKNLANLKTKGKKFKSFAKMYDEAIAPDQILSSYVSFLVARGSTADVAVKVTVDMNDLPSYTVEGVGAVTEVEAQYLIAFGSPFNGDLAAYEKRWGVSAGWQADIRDFGGVGTLQAGRPMSWRTITSDGGKTLKPSDVCDYDGYPMPYAYQAVKQMIFKGLADDGAEQLALPLFLSPFDLIVE